MVQVIPERGNTYTLEVRPVGHPGMTFLPGQFAWITVQNSPFSDTEHPFSISSSAERSNCLSFTIREFGNFTRGIKNLQPGQRVWVDGPYGAFSVDRQTHAKGFAFIAGGVGITPMMSMLRTLADRRDQRPLLLIYANKDWENVIFREEIEQLKENLNLRLVHVIENPSENWHGEKGFISLEMLERILPKPTQRNDWEIFICGPEPMMNSVENNLSKLGVWWGDFHSERFNLV